MEDIEVDTEYDGETKDAFCQFDQLMYKQWNASSILDELKQLLHSSLLLFFAYIKEHKTYALHNSCYSKAPLVVIGAIYMTWPGTMQKLEWTKGTTWFEKAGFTTTRKSIG